MTRRTLYVDHESLEELEKVMGRYDFIKFLEIRMLIPIDDKARNFLMKLKEEKINRNTKKLI